MGMELGWDVVWGVFRMLKQGFTQHDCLWYGIGVVLLVRGSFESAAVVVRDTIVMSELFGIQLAIDDTFRSRCCPSQGLGRGVETLSRQPCPVCLLSPQDARHSRTGQPDRSVVTQPRP